MKPTHACSSVNQCLSKLRTRVSGRLGPDTSGAWGLRVPVLFDKGQIVIIGAESLIRSPFQSLNFTLAAKEGGIGGENGFGGGFAEVLGTHGTHGS
jgi:hypothetical protein